MYGASSAASKTTSVIEAQSKMMALDVLNELASYEDVM